MTAFKVGELVTQDVSSFNIGQAFMDARPRGGNPHSIGVRCATYDSPPFGTFLMATPDGLSLHWFRSSELSGMKAIKLDISDLRFELSPKSLAIAIDGLAAGLLIVNESGAFLSVMYKDPQFDISAQVTYLNLSDWTKSQYAPPSASGFAEWKLVATQDGERIILFESSAA